MIFLPRFAICGISAGMYLMPRPTAFPVHQELASSDGEPGAILTPLRQNCNVMLMRTPRLVLRDFTAEDWPAVLAYHRHPAYMRFNPWTERSEDDARAFVNMFIAWQHVEPRHKFQLAITLAETGEVIGNIGIRLPHPGAHEAELGYELSPLHWGQGYATEAAQTMVDFAFSELKLDKLVADCNAENTASARVLEKLGFILREKQERAVYFKGRWWDTLVYELVEIPNNKFRPK